MIRAVGFDLDNTLFDHIGAATAGLSALLQEHGWVYKGATEIGEEWQRIERAHFSEYIAGNLTLIEQRRERMREFLGLINVEATQAELDELFENYLSHYSTSWVAFPDVQPTLKILRESGFPLAVLSNGQQSQQEGKLLGMGIRQYFVSVLAIGTLKFPKPDARAFLQLCATLGYAPNEIMYVGDDPQIDVMPATDVGFRSVWLNRHKLETPYGIENEIHTLDLLIDLI